MKITKMKTMPVVVSGERRGVISGNNCLQGSWVRLAHFDGDRFLWDWLPANRRSALPFPRLIDFLAEVLKHLGRPLERAAPPDDAAKALDLFAKRRLVARQVACQLVHLRDHHGAEAEDYRECERDDGQYGEDSGNTQALCDAHQRREDEAQEDRESDRDQHLAPEIERGDDGDPKQHRREG